MQNYALHAEQLSAMAPDRSHFHLHFLYAGHRLHQRVLNYSIKRKEIPFTVWGLGFFLSLLLLLFTVCKFLIVKDAVDGVFLLNTAVLFSHDTPGDLT